MKVNNKVGSLKGPLRKRNGPLLRRALFAAKEILVGHINSTLQGFRAGNAMLMAYILHY